MRHTASPLQDVFGRSKMPKMKADHHLHCLATVICYSSWLVNNLIQWSRSYISGGQLQVTPRLSARLSQLQPAVGVQWPGTQICFQKPSWQESFTGWSFAPLISLLAEPFPECFLLSKSEQDFLSPTSPTKSLMSLSCLRNPSSYSDSWRKEIAKKKMHSNTQQE